MKKIVITCKSLLFIMALFMIISNVACSKSSGDADEKAPLSFSTQSPIKPTASGGKATIVINVTGGQWPYTFYVIPETEWIAGDMMQDMLEHNNFSRLYRFRYIRNTIEVTAGTTTVPRYYWVAAQDNAKTATLSGTNMLSWWKRVAAYDL
ncbi:MAG: hypothetical protein IPH18_16625 [Chitinophagaceae bacterium]|jgi:hypothetical protein|nr:hypothetical protein [Chitinophagaceae bacterium]